MFFLGGIPFVVKEFNVQGVYATTTEEDRLIGWVELLQGGVETERDVAIHFRQLEQGATTRLMIAEQRLQGCLRALLQSRGEVERLRAEMQELIAQRSRKLSTIMNRAMGCAWSDQRSCDLRPCGPGLCCRVCDMAAACRDCCTLIRMNLQRGRDPVIERAIARAKRQVEKAEGRMQALLTWREQLDNERERTRAESDAIGLAKTAFGEGKAREEI